MRRKLQSAVEYLMTYGWSILILAVALSALYMLGVLNPSSFAGQQCSLQAGLSCTVVGLTTAGLLTINLIQTTSSQINITAIGCNSNSIAQNIQQYSAANQIALQPDANMTLTVQCWAGSSPLSAPLGSAFLGYLVINYNETYTGFPHSASGKVLAKSSLPATTVSLYLGVHTASQCSAASGNVVSDGSGNNMCQFNAASCPGGWVQYLNWMATASATQSGPACSYGCCSGSPNSVTNPGHAWMNHDSHYPLAGTICGSYDACWTDSCGCCARMGYGTITQIGCY
jgi:hypothetical protein